MINEEESYFDDFLDDPDEEIVEDIDINEIDFSDASGGFKRSLKKGTKKALKKRKIKPKAKQKIIIPDDRKIIIQGMDKFLLGNDCSSESIRNIGYYKGKRLQAMVFTINNEGLLDFEVQLFNPSMPLDYLFSTGLDLNNKITVGGSGSEVSYRDVLNYISANPMLIPNMRIVISGPQDTAQRGQSIQIINKGVSGVSFIKPINLGLQIDNMQVDANIVQFDLECTLGRAYVPDGMDIMKYTVLAGNTVTFAFFYKQKQIKRMAFKETHNKKII